MKQNQGRLDDDYEDGLCGGFYSHNRYKHVRRSKSKQKNKKFKKSY